MAQVVHSYKELIVWQRGIELTVAMYELTEQFPREEIYGLTSQMRRSAVSIPANIAEGRLRGSRADFLNFLRIAYVSGGELETHIIIAKQLSKAKNFDYDRVDNLLQEVMKMLHAMIKTMNPNKAIKS